MKIIEAQELKEVKIPIEGILRPDGSFKIAPEVRNYFDIEYKPKTDHLKLVAGGKIGIIPLNDEISVDIKPKFPISNLIHVISRSGDELNSLEFFSRQYSTLTQSTSNLFVFFAKSLAKELENLDLEGLLKTYNLKSQLVNSPQGRINFSKTIQQAWSKQRYTQLNVEHFEYTIDNAFNRLIKFCIWFCLQHLSRRHTDEQALIGTLSYYFDLMHSVPVDTQRSYEDSINTLIMSNKIPQLRHYYLNIAKLCLLITNDKGVSLSGAGTDVNMMSFSLDMATVFENYILNVLREYQVEISPNVYIQDGNKEGKQPLFSDRKGSPAKPDFILKRNEKTLLLMDAKYKLGLKEADRYQIISHSLSYDSNIAVLICPKPEGGREGLHYFGSIGQSYQIKVYEYFFNMAAEDLILEEKLLISEIKKLLPK